MTEQPPQDPAAQPPAPAAGRSPAYAAGAAAATGVRAGSRSGDPARLRLPAGRRPPVGPAPTAPGGSPAGNFTSSRGKTIGLIVAGVVAVGALGGIGAAIFGGDDEDAFTDTTTGGTVEPGEEVTPEPDGGILAPSPIGSATPEPSDGTEPSPTAEPSPLPTDEATADPRPGARR